MDLPGHPGKFYFYLTAQPLLTVDRLTLQAGQRRIVEALSFDIYPGEIVALTGRSGSGKTSIALSILDLLPTGLVIQGGTFLWQEEHTLISGATDQHAWRQLRGNKIGFVQQDVFGAFDPVLSMERQMLLMLSEKTNSPADRLLQELKLRTEEVGLHDLSRLLKSYPFQLSGGQLQRCMIALVMTLKPSLIILDEPTSAIDKMNQHDLLHMLARLREKNQVAILCITHEGDVVNALADREINLEGMRKEPMDMGTVIHPTNIPTTSPVLEGQQLEYAYHFGGLIHKSGATIGALDFKLYPGSCIGIVGESGSGKSTLAQLLVGLIEPQKGELRLDGSAINFKHKADLGRLRSSVQLVMQDGRGSLHPYQTIGQTLKEVSHVWLRHFNRVTQPPDAVLEEVGLSVDMLQRRPAQLSGGERLRVSIARALLVNPRVLICDESTSSLDSETREGVVSLLAGLMSTRAMALVFISHDIALIRRLSDQIIVMAAGQIVEQGDATSVLTYPTHPVSKRIFTPDATSFRNLSP